MRNLMLIILFTSHLKAEYLLLQNRRSPCLSIFHINIRSLNKNFEKLQDFLSELKGEISVIVLRETWFTDDKTGKDFLLQISSSTPVYQKKQITQRGRIAAFIHNKLDFKILKILNNNNNDIENLTIEIFQDHIKNILVSVIYGPSRGNSNKFINTMNNLFKKMHENQLLLVGDLNLTSLEYYKSSPVTNFVNLCFQHTIFLLINRPTRVSKKSGIAMDYKMTNTFLQAEVSSNIIKTEISDYFPIFATMKITKIQNILSPRTIRKHKINENSIDSIISLLKIIDWDLVK